MENEDRTGKIPNEVEADGDVARRGREPSPFPEDNEAMPPQVEAMFCVAEGDDEEMSRYDSDLSLGADIKRVLVLGGQGWIELTDHMGDELKIVNAARIAYGRESMALSDNDKAVLKALLTNGHTSPLEQVTFTFKVKAPIFVVRQWFRHRTWSFNEMSRRYSRKIPEFYMPSVFTGDKVSPEDRETAARVIRSLYMAAVNAYGRLLMMQMKAEQARIVLPVATMTEFFGTVNLNNLIKFVNLRAEKHAQLEIREYAEAIKLLVKPILPTVAEALGW